MGGEGRSQLHVTIRSWSPSKGNPVSMGAGEHQQTREARTHTHNGPHEIQLQRQGVEATLTPSTPTDWLSPEPGGASSVSLLAAIDPSAGVTDVHYTTLLRTSGNRNARGNDQQNAKPTKAVRRQMAITTPELSLLALSNHRQERDSFYKSAQWSVSTTQTVATSR